MVRTKRLIMILSLAAALVLAVPSSAFAHDIYTDGNISSTYTTIFQDLNLSPFDDYVYFRSGQYEYTLIVGDIELNGSRFSSSEIVTNYTINTQSGTGYGNNIYKYTVTEENGFDLNASNYLVYSNLGSYPQLTERGESYELLTAFLLCLALGLYVLRSVFWFCLRAKR